VTLACGILGHRYRFTADGAVMRWRCQRDCGAGGAKAYESAAAAGRFAAAFDQEDRDELGRRAPLVGLLPLRAWSVIRRRRGGQSAGGRLHAGTGVLVRRYPPGPGSDRGLVGRQRDRMQVFEHRRQPARNLRRPGAIVPDFPGRQVKEIGVPVLRHHRADLAFAVAAAAKASGAFNTSRPR
jgi:hypothetical protein